MSISLNYAELYSLTDPFGTQAIRLDFGENMEWMTSQYAWSLFKGQIAHTDKSINLQGYQGRRPMDFLWSAFVPLRCISKWVVDLLQANRVTGWAIYPVQVHDRDGKLLPDYFGFAVTGRGGSFDSSMSEVVTKSAPGKPYQAYIGYYFDESNWDGSDIFLVSNRIIIKRRVRDLFRKEKVRNILLTSLPEVETPTYLDEFRDA
jgi:hypothetical protein